MNFVSLDKHTPRNRILIDVGYSELELRYMRLLRPILRSPTRKPCVHWVGGLLPLLQELFVPSAYSEDELTALARRCGLIRNLWNESPTGRYLRAPELQNIPPRRQNKPRS